MLIPSAIGAQVSILNSGHQLALLQSQMQPLGLSGPKRAELRITGDAVEMTCAKGKFRVPMPVPNSASPLHDPLSVFERLQGLAALAAPESLTLKVETHRDCLPIEAWAVRQMRQQLSPDNFVFSFNSRDKIVSAISDRADPPSLMSGWRWPTSLRRGPAPNVDLTVAPGALRARRKSEELNFPLESDSGLLISHPGPLFAALQRIKDHWALPHGTYVSVSINRRGMDHLQPHASPEAPLSPLEWVALNHAGAALRLQLEERDTTRRVAAWRFAWSAEPTSVLRAPAWALAAAYSGALLACGALGAAGARAALVLLVALPVGCGLWQWAKQRSTLRAQQRERDRYADRLARVARCPEPPA